MANQTSDHFERLGLPRRFLLDEAEIQRQYLSRSRQVHPDFFQLGSDLEQRASVESSAALNEAYAVLHEPFRRAEYLLSLEGGPTATALKDVPVEFLEEMLELRMEIEQIKQNPGSPQFAAIEKQLVERRRALLDKVGQLFDQAGPDRLREIRRILNATKYVQGLLRDLQAD